MNIELWGLNRFDQLGRITTATRVRVVERDLKEGGWLVELPLSDGGDVGAALLAATWPGIELYDRDTGWRFGGYLTDHEIEIDPGAGTETLRLIGRDFQSDLAAWLEAPDSADLNQWWANTYGGTIPATADAHNTVATNAGPGAVAVGRPAIDGLTLAPAVSGGDAKARRLKGEPLLDVCRYLLADQPYTARLRLVRAANGDGAVQFETPVRQVAPIVLDAQRGTAGRVRVRTSAAKASWVLAMGAEVEPVVTPGERLVVSAPSTEGHWQVRHREVAINRPATDSISALSDEALSVLLDPDSWRRQSVQVDSARIDGYGRDIDLGWLVDVHLGPRFTPRTVRLPVVASTIEFTPATGWVRTIDLGSEALDGPAAIYAQVARARAQLRQVESDSR